MQLKVACEVQLPSTGLEEVVRHGKQKIYKLVRSILLQLMEVGVKVAGCPWAL